MVSIEWKRWAAAAAALAVWGCGPVETKQEAALKGVKQYVQSNLDALNAAAVALQTAAPAADADGWSASADAAAVASMRAEWKKARTAYERVEGAIAVLFPDLDVSTDERYDGFLALGADTNLFDGEGVTGVHAIERVLWADAIPASVVTFEKEIPGYKAAAFPANAAEAEDFKAKLCARLVSDTQKMKADFAPLALDTAAAYRGVIGSMAEQVEKVTKAASGEEESRYAQYTLADLRANVEGGKETFAAFKGWLLEKSGGSDQEAKIAAGFKRLDAAYALLTGDSLPAVPATWSSAKPSEADLQTPFGKLFKALQDEADPEKAGSLVFDMNTSADLLGIAQLPE